MFTTRFWLARMNPAPEEMAALRQQGHLERRQSSPECLDELAIADFVDGLLEGSRRAEVISHLTACAHCRSAVRGTAALVANAAVARQAPRDRLRTGVWAAGSVAVAAAAAAVLVLMLWPTSDRSTLREAAVTDAIAPAALMPRGDVAAVERMVWSKVPNAERYRLRVQGRDGSVLWSAETQDTSFALPDSVRLVRGDSYFWSVEAQTDWRRWVASGMTSFRIQSRAR